MYMKKYIILLAATVLACACSREKAKVTLHSVMTVTPESVSSESQKRFSGIVKENAEASLGFKTAGQIERILVKEGDHVRKGQLLAQLDAKDYQLGVNAAQIQYDQLKNEVERMRLLYEGKSLSGNDYEKALSGLEQLGIQLQANKNKLEYTRLYAPQDGIIQRVNFEQAEMVNAGTPVFTLLDLHRMEVEVSLPQSVYAQRDHFGAIQCVADGETYPLHLVSIVPKADNNQLYTAKFSLGGVRLTAGQNVDVTINLTTIGNAGHLVLPLSCIFEDAGKACVWKVSADSVVHRQEVSVSGTDDTGRAIITVGLTGKETIVRAGTGALREGEKVKIVGQPSATNVGGLI